LESFTTKVDGIVTPAVTMAMQETFKPGQHPETTARNRAE